MGGRRRRGDDAHVVGAGPAGGRHPRRLPRDPPRRPLHGVPPGRRRRAVRPHRPPRLPGRDLERHAVPQPAVERRAPGHVPAPRARVDVGHDARPQARQGRPVRRGQAGAALLQARPRGHPVALVEGRAGRPAGLPRRRRHRGAARHRQPVHPRRRGQVARPADHDRVPAGAGQAGRPAGAGRARRPQPGAQPQAPHRGRRLRATPHQGGDRRARRQRLGHHARLHDRRRARRPHAPGLGHRLGLRPRGLGHDAHRGRGLRHARGGEPHRRPRRRGGRRVERPPGRPRPRVRRRPRPGPRRRGPPPEAHRRRPGPRAHADVERDLDRADARSSPPKCRGAAARR